MVTKYHRFIQGREQMLLVPTAVLYERHVVAKTTWSNEKS